MKSVLVSKAKGIGFTEVDPCTIEISVPLPEFWDREDYETASRGLYERQADVIVDALQAHLPGGTFDAVLRAMCNRKACLLQVPIR